MAIVIAKAPPYSYMRFKFLSWIGIFSKQVAPNPRGIKQQLLSCRVKLKEEKNQNVNSDTFSIEISGSIHAAKSVDNTFTRIYILDIKDGFSESKSVYNSTKEQRTSDPSVFCCQSTLGKLSENVTAIPQWTPIAQLDIAQLMFPRKGKRNLQINASILSSSTCEELACATCTFVYENSKLGYIDIAENNQRAKTLAVPIAFIIGSTDSKLCDSQVATIKKWEESNVHTPQTPNNAIKRLKKALVQAVSFFCRGNERNIYKSCLQIARMASVGVRYDIMDFFLCVTQASGIASAGQLALLNKLANWLEVDHERFRSMRGKILPAHMHEVKDINDILGIYPDMNKGQIRQHLNHEYRKWNAITVSCNSEIQAQATHMLKLIGEARSQYI